MSRETRMAARREAGKTYKYKSYAKNEEGSVSEMIKRARKNKSHKLPLAKWTSVMRKVENQVEAEKQMRAKANRKKRGEAVSEE